MSMTQVSSNDGPSFDDLNAQHADYEDRLEQLKSKSWLTPDEEYEEKRLKKLKLQVKDRIASMQKVAD